MGTTSWSRNIQERHVSDKLSVFSIVAMHGLGAHPDHTWTKIRIDEATGSHDEGRWVNWLQEEDMLPTAVPKSRIMRYGYKSNWFGEDAIRTSIRDIAEMLLFDLVLEREVRQSLLQRRRFY